MKKPVIRAIEVYQGLTFAKTSLLWSVFGYQPVCKHNPSCSQFTHQAIEKHGTIIGLMTGFSRIIRCW